MDTPAQTTAAEPEAVDLPIPVLQDEPLSCEWVVAADGTKCSILFANGTLLYQHLQDVHVTRKPSGGSSAASKDKNLFCRWAKCPHGVEEFKKHAASHKLLDAKKFNANNPITPASHSPPNVHNPYISRPPPSYPPYFASYEGQSPRPRPHYLGPPAPYPPHYGSQYPLQAHPSVPFYPQQHPNHPHSRPYYPNEYNRPPPPQSYYPPAPGHIHHYNTPQDSPYPPHQSPAEYRPPHPAAPPTHYPHSSDPDSATRQPPPPPPSQYPEYAPTQPHPHPDSYSPRYVPSQMQVPSQPYPEHYTEPARTLVRPQGPMHSSPHRYSPYPPPHPRSYGPPGLSHSYPYPPPPPPTAEQYPPVQYPHVPPPPPPAAAAAAASHPYPYSGYPYSEQHLSTVCSNEAKYVQLKQEPTATAPYPRQPYHEYQLQVAKSEHIYPPPSTQYSPQHVASMEYPQNGVSNDQRSCSQEEALTLQQHIESELRSCNSKAEEENVVRETGKEVVKEEVV
ncbi:UNVERIFIED_CONTAM: hypothetical protein HDU68_000758 [Siphonaria sp. JEL0065]|nr:hypothetical protein HDU68_000758 [Siphonaria sp. JEL0065]